MTFKEAYDNCLTREHRLKRTDWPKEYHIEAGSSLVYVGEVYLCNKSTRLHKYSFMVGELFSNDWCPSPYLGPSAFFKQSNEDK